jgi:hypothetical protein
MDGWNSGGEIRFTYLSALDVAQLAMTDGEILDAVEAGVCWRRAAARR